MDPARCKTMKNLPLFAHKTISSRNSIVDTAFFFGSLDPSLSIVRDHLEEQ
jgi:hypothetical protein